MLGRLSRMRAPLTRGRRSPCRPAAGWNLLRESPLQIEPLEPRQLRQRQTVRVRGPLGQPLHQAHQVVAGPGGGDVATVDAPVSVQMVRHVDVQGVQGKGDAKKKIPAGEISGIGD